MRVFRMFTLGIFVFVLGPNAVAQQEIPKDLEITLIRYPCFGWCPHYSLTISADGIVKFMPLGPPAYRGQGEKPRFPLMGNMTGDQLKILLAEFERIRFTSLRRRYGSAGKSKVGPSCPKYWTDSSSAQISIVKAGKGKTVSHYLGCEGAQILNDLETLENKIDEVANSAQWTSQFGWGSASVIDLKLQVVPTPKKPQ